MIDLAGARRTVERLDAYRLNGRVSELIGLVIESRGPEAGVGERCEIRVRGHRVGAPPLEAEVVGFREGRTLLMPLGEPEGLAPGQTVVATGQALRVSVGPQLLGRVLDGLGRPMDGLPAPELVATRPVDGAPPDPLTRPPIDTPLTLGVRAIDTLMPCGRGQRMGIFAGSGVGKSTTLGMMARNTTADVNVIALVGERGREVREFIEHDLGPEGLARSVLVIATSDQPALIRIKAAFVATAIAEYFRDAGNDVLLMMDSVTRLATAQREVGLAIGEPPATRGYTPSVFAILPRLLERAGAAATGSITALYTVLVEGDDMNEPVADAVRSILDGHIVLSRELAHRHHYPAIDVLQSVSRVAPRLLAPHEGVAAGHVRTLLAAHKRAEDLIAIGAYVPGSDPQVDEARAKLERINAFLRQPVDGPYRRDEALGEMCAIADVAPPVEPVAQDAASGGRPVADGPPPIVPDEEPRGGLTGAFNPLPPGAEVVGG